MDLLRNEVQIQENNLVTTLKEYRKEFIISLDLKLTSIVNDWTSVIHFTIGENIGRYGDRIPAILIWQGNLHIRTAANGNNDYTYIGGMLTIGKWISIKVQQIKESDASYNYSIIINGKLVHSVTNTIPEDFNNVKLYAADPWHIPQPGFIKNFIVYRKYDGSFYFFKEHSIL